MNLFLTVIELLVVLLSVEILDVGCRISGSSRILARDAESRDLKIGC